MAKKPELFDVTLEYRYGRMGKANSIAKCKARLTPKQIVVVSGTVVDGRACLGGLPYRFERSFGRPTPRYVSSAGWYLASEDRRRFSETITTESDT